jgi:hypothetical protein
MSNRKQSSKIPGPARMLLLQLSVAYADATEPEWEELRGHMHDKMSSVGAGTPARQELVLREFEKVRATALAGLRVRQVAAALADGGATLARDRGDGLEEWTVTTVAGDELRMFLPTEGDPVGLEQARNALLKGKCRTCKLSPQIVGDIVEIPHNPRCPALKVLD